MIKIVAACIAILMCSTAGNAQTNWPSRTVKFIVPNQPGSGADIAARLFADRLSTLWGKPVVVENRQGSEGIAAVQSFLSAQDEHTLLLSGISIISINSVLFEKLPYDPDKDLIPIAAMVDNFIGIAATKLLGSASLGEVLLTAKAKPGSFNWAATPGTSTAVMLSLIKSSGVEATRVPYRDFAAAFEDLAQGRLHLFSTSLPGLMPTVERGSGVLLMVTNSRRSPQSPGTPTAAEVGHPDLTFDAPFGAFGWRGISNVLVSQISADISRVGKDEDLSKKLIAAGIAVRSEDSDSFRKTIADQKRKIADLYKSP